MIHKLRLNFIRIAMAALTAAVILVAAAINIMNWLNVRSEIGETISFLAESDGMISQEKAHRTWYIRGDQCCSRRWILTGRGAYCR